MVALGILAPSFTFGVETGTSTNQAANFYATNSMTLRGTTITGWRDLTNVLDSFYVRDASFWSHYPAVGNVDLANRELINVSALTLGGRRRRDWPGQTITFLAQGSAFRWRNQPTDMTEFAGYTIHRTQVDLSDYTEARLTVLVATANTTQGAGILVQYSTDQSDWDYLDGDSGPGVSITSTGLKASKWVKLTQGARQDVCIRIVGIKGGDRSPSFGLITLQLK